MKFETKSEIVSVIERLLKIASPVAALPRLPTEQQQQELELPNAPSKRTVTLFLKL